MSNPTFSFSEPATSEIWRLRRIVNQVVAEPVAEISLDLFGVVSMALMISTGLLDSVETAPLSIHLSLSPSFERRRKLFFAACLSMEAAWRLHSAGIKLVDVMNFSIEPEGWRPAEPLPSASRPFVRAFRDTIPSEYDELQSLSLHELWWLAQPRLEAKGVIEWCPSPDH